MPSPAPNTRRNPNLRSKPWEKDGISRRTWERRRDASPSEVKLLSTADTLASPKQAPPPRELAIDLQALGSNVKAATKPQKPKQKRRASVDATAPLDQRTHLRHEPTPEPTEPARQIELEPSAVDGDDMSDTKQEQDLISMITVLRTFFGNRTTSMAWYRHMQDFCGPGWSKPSFKRRLKTLKHRKWIAIVGEPDADLERAPVGSLFAATAIAPGAPVPVGSPWVPESAAMNGTTESARLGGSGAADAAAEAARELLERLSKGKTAA